MKVPFNASLKRDWLKVLFPQVPSNAVAYRGAKMLAGSGRKRAVSQSRLSAGLEGTFIVPPFADNNASNTQ